MRLSKSKWCIGASVYRHWITKNTTHNIQVHTHKWKMTQFKVRDAKSITWKLLNLSHFENVMIIAPNYISKNTAVSAQVFDSHWFTTCRGATESFQSGALLPFSGFPALPSSSMKVIKNVIRASLLFIYFVSAFVCLLCVIQRPSSQRSP